MYGRFLADCKVINPAVRVGGLTATPFRLDKGMICRPDAIMNHVCHETGVKELIRDGWLCRLKCKAGEASADLSGVHRRGGEFVPDEMAAAFDQEKLVAIACAELLTLAEGRKGILVFCSSVEHGRHVQAALGDGAGFVCGETPLAKRDRLIEGFKRGDIRIMVNCQVLTTGFDATHIDCIALLRATLSPGLYYQMVGRGLRTHPNKSDCLILDYGGNVRRHGPIDALRIKEKAGAGGAAPVKECPGCHCLIHAAYSVCPECGTVFENEKKPAHGVRSDGAPILSGEVTETEFEVRDIRYREHHKRDNPDAPPTMRVDYHVGWERWQSEWVCFEHDGFARRKAEQWWAARSALPCPETVKEAVLLCEKNMAAVPSKITVREVSGEHFARIIKAEIVERFEPGESWENPVLAPVQETIPW